MGGRAIVRLVQLLTLRRRVGRRPTRRRTRPPRVTAQARTTGVIETCWLYRVSFSCSNRSPPSTHPLGYRFEAVFFLAVAFGAGSSSSSACSASTLMTVSASSVSFLSASPSSSSVSCRSVAASS